MSASTLGPENPGLRHDPQHRKVLDAAASFPADYYMTQFEFPAPPVGCNRAACKQFSVTPDRIDGDSTLHPEKGKFRLRGCGQLPQTELFGTSPYAVTGRGELTDTDTSTALRDAPLVFKDGSRACWTSRDAGPPARRAMPPPPPRAFDARGGTLTNIDPQVYYARGGR